jgi:hypothetical protein
MTAPATFTSGLATKRLGDEQRSSLHSTAALRHHDLAAADRAQRAHQRQEATRSGVVKERKPEGVCNESRDR